MSIIMLINLKGGVAKTTSAVAIAECLASKGYRTLLIDADHQCTSSELLLGEAKHHRCEATKRTLYDLFTDLLLENDFDRKKFESYISPKVSNISGGLPKLSVLPCSIRMDGFSENMAKAFFTNNRSQKEFQDTINNRSSQFSRWLNTNFDYTIIDNPPSFSNRHVRFLMSVADSYIVPTIPDRLSVRGSLELLNRMKSHRYKLNSLGTLWSMYRSQNSMHCHFIDATKRGIDPFNRLPKPFDTIIPNATKIAESTNIDKSNPATFRHKYSPEFSGLFEALCGEIVRRVELSKQSF
jgi:chromosome partitioning protein